MRSLAVAFFVGVSFGSFHSPMMSLGPAGCTLASHNPDEMSVVTPPREDKLSERLEEMGKELDKMKQFAGHKGSQLLLEETDKILKEMKRFTDKLQLTMIGNNVSSLQLEVQFMRLRAQSGSENLRKKMEVQENQASETKSVTPAVLEQPPAGEDGKEEAEQELEDDTMGSQEKNRSFFTAGRNWLEAFSDSEDPPPQDQPVVDDSKAEQPPAGEDGKEEAEEELEDHTMGSQEKDRSFFTAGRNWLEAFSDSEDPPPQDQLVVDDSKVVQSR